MQGLAHSQGFDENTDVPDAADYQAPFGNEAEKISECFLLNDIKKQLDLLPSERMQDMQKQRDETKRELQELREEIRQDLQEMRNERREELRNEIHEIREDTKYLINAVRKIAGDTEDTVKGNEPIAN